MDGVWGGVLLVVEHGGRGVQRRGLREVLVARDAVVAVAVAIGVVHVAQVHAGRGPAVDDGAVLAD